MSDAAGAIAVAAQEHPLAVARSVLRAAALPGTDSSAPHLVYLGFHHIYLPLTLVGSMQVPSPSPPRTTPSPLHHRSITQLRYQVSLCVSLLFCFLCISLFFLSFLLLLAFIPVSDAGATQNHSLALAVAVARPEHHAPVFPGNDPIQLFPFFCRRC